MLFRSQIDKVINFKGSDEERLIVEIFNGFSYGNNYWLPKKWADKIGHTIPTYEELCEKYGFKWADKEVPLGWIKERRKVFS